MGFYYPRSVMILTVRWEESEYNKKPTSGVRSIGDAGKNLRTSEIVVYPKNVRVKINSYQEADTFSAELDYKSFPFDPRTIRACQVTIYIKNVQGEYKPTIKDLSDVVFTGFADEESITLDDSRRVVRLEGRDLTSLLIDKKFGRGTVEINKDIKTLYEDFLTEVPGAESIDVVVRGDLDLPTLSKFLPDPSLKSMNIKESESYWGVIQELASRAGLITFIEIDKLVISKPRALYDGAKQKAVRFVYGKNIKALEYKKKIGRRKGFNVIVRSMNPLEKVVMTVKIPKEATDAWSDATGIPNVEVKIPDVDKEGKEIAYADLKPAPYIAFTIPDVKYQAQLIEIGEQAYESMAREQIEGTLDTFEMDSSTQDGSDFDLLKLRMGTPIKVEIEQTDLSALGSMAKPEEKKKFLLKRGYSSQVANALTENLNRLSNFMYTRSVEFDLNPTQFKVRVDFINFIETKLGV